MSSPSTPKEDNPRVPISNLATGTRGDHWRAVILVSRSLELQPPFHVWLDIRLEANLVVP